MSRTRTIVTTLIAACALLVPALASAADPPDMKGRWVGKTHSIIAGKGGHWPSSTASLDKPGLFEKDVVLEVTGQQDRRFWGVTTISGGSERTQEPFIGQLGGKDYKKVVTADTDGFIWGDLEGDTLSYCYAQVGTAAVVSCTEVKRAK